MLPSIFTENLFDDFFDAPMTQSFFQDPEHVLYGKHAKNLMKTDVRDANDHYELDIELPGFQKENVNVELKDGYLAISAEKDLDKDTQKKGHTYLRRERFAGSCSRSFYVGDVQPQDVKCRYESGVLTVSLPKQDAKALPASNRIAIE